MTNREAIDHILAWHRGSLDEMVPTALDHVLALAEAQVAMTPPPGSVEVRVAVAADGRSAVACPVVGWTGSGALEECRAELEQDCTHAAIVAAWIPPVATPEVRGRVE